MQSYAKQCKAMLEHLPYASAQLRLASPARSLARTHARTFLGSLSLLGHSLTRSILRSLLMQGSKPAGSRDAWKAGSKRSAEKSAASGSSAEMSAASGSSAEKSAEKPAESERPAKRQKVDEQENAEVRVGYYNANYNRSVRNHQAVDSWLQTCVHDVRTAIKDDGLNVICLVGLGGYGELYGLEKLPLWLGKYDEHLPTALLRYIVANMPDTWEVFSFGSYGVMVLVTDVRIIIKPHILECEIQADFRPRPFVSLEVCSVHATNVLENRLEVWIVENEGNAHYPLCALARDTILRFLLQAAGRGAIWGGMLNMGLISLSDAGAEYKEESREYEAWRVLLCSTGDRDSVALCRGVDVKECVRVPSAKHMTFISVTVRMGPGRVEKPTTATLQTSRLAKDLETYADEGDEATKEIVHEMLRFLWWKGTFIRDSSAALQEGYQRLNEMTEEIERVRTTYSRVEKPAADYQFDEKETAHIHNTYMRSLTWMNDEVREEYDSLEAKHHAFLKGRFNVYFAKTWGSKAFFMHLVRFGTSSDIAAMVRVFGHFRESQEYKQIVQANSEKSEEERELKKWRDQLRRWRGRSDSDEQEYQIAKQAYETLGRGGAGVSQGSWVDSASSSVAKPAAPYSEV
jgi:hypothetical protein